MNLRPTGYEQLIPGLKPGGQRSQSGVLVSAALTVRRRIEMDNFMFKRQKLLALLAALFHLDFTFLVFLISHGDPKMTTVPRKSKQKQLSERRH